MKVQPATRPPNPDVEPEQPGWCLRHDGLSLWWSERGWVKDYRQATVYALESSARLGSQRIAGASVTTVPRSNGHFVSWGEAPSP